MEYIDQELEETEVKVTPTPIRDRGDISHAISEGLYLNVFRTDRMSVERPGGVIVFKM